MASVLTHFLIAENYIEKFKNFDEEDIVSFLVGAVAADTPNSLGKGFEEREASHFGSSPSMTLLEKGNFNLDGDVLSYDSFFDKYKNQLDDPFIEGYLLHLYTDKRWFTEIITELLNKYASEIKENAKTAYDLSFKEAILWYTKNLYQTYNAHDIFFHPYINLEHIKKMSMYDVRKCPVDIINKQDLEIMLANFKAKCEENAKEDGISELDLLISTDTMLSFISSTSTEMHDLYFKDLYTKKDGFR